MLTLNMEESSDQTKAIFRALARQVREQDQDYSDWHSLQEWLGYRPVDVWVPYFDALVDLMPAVAVRLRRDISTVIRLVRAHALLHRKTRKRTRGGMILANFDDYDAVHALVADEIAAAVDATVPATVREIVNAVARLKPRRGGVSMRELSVDLDRNVSTVSRHAKVAIEGGYLRNTETRAGQRARA